METPYPPLKQSFPMHPTCVCFFPTFPPYPQPSDGCLGGLVWLSTLFSSKSKTNEEPDGITTRLSKQNGVKIWILGNTCQPTSIDFFFNLL